MDSNGNLKLVYVRPVGKGDNDIYEYDLLFSEFPDDVWALFWDDPNPSSCGDLTPDAVTYNEVKRIGINYELMTLQNTNCFSMEHAIHGVVALAWVDIENLEEYPSTRFVLQFGYSMDVIESMVESNNDIVSFV